MRLVRLGRNGPGVSEMGLSCMGMSGGNGHADDAESIATIHAALEADITMVDTGDFATPPPHRRAQPAIPAVRW